MENIKKYIPLIILAVGVLILILSLVLFKKKSAGVVQLEVNEEENLAEIPFEDRPFASLIPSKDGHWLKLKVENIKTKASSVDYEILYQLPDGRTQGVPGTIKITEPNFERDILLGSESSGKYRYDEGVKSGTLTLKFRDDKGKLISKLSTAFNLFSETKELNFSDGKFSYLLDDLPKGVYFVVMETFGVNSKPDFEIVSGPYGVFASVDKKFTGKVVLDSDGIYYLQDDSWMKLDSGRSPNIGIFSSGK
ncbi:MAG: hypothetical protein KatS3mg088_503 [Patescibacteria group bacterium]|nr:MAG: hypothetical protein KatS3mg088_503 [Patescibacteria group bacterium]